MEIDSPPPDHDPDLARFFDAVVALSADRHSRGPESFLATLDDLEQTFRELRRYRTEKILRERLEAFVVRRFELVDDAEEYALACDETLVLSMALGDAAWLAVPALKRAVDRASHALTAPGVPPLFGQLLKRLRQLARKHADAELEAWVRGVASALPGD